MLDIPRAGAHALWKKPAFFLFIEGKENDFSCEK